MNVVVNIIAIGLSVFLLAVPLVNRYVFKTINVDEIAVAGRTAIQKIRVLQQEQKFQESIDSCTAIIGRYSADSTRLYVSDIKDWDAVKAIVTGKAQHPWSLVITGDVEESAIALLTENDPLPPSVQNSIVGSLNILVKNPDFYWENKDRLDLNGREDVLSRINLLKVQGIVNDSGPKDRLTESELSQVRRLNVLLLEKVVFPGIIEKNLKKGKDWASEFIVQTAMYFTGFAYKGQQELEEAVNVWNKLIETYPKSIYAEVLFLQIGQVLCDEGKNRLGDNDPGIAELRFHEAIGWLQRLEMNREIAMEFPKYKYADLKPGKYVNVDQASRAKSQIRQKTEIYTSSKAKEELEGKSSDDRSGYMLEDAIKLIGECYIYLGETDSARGQFALLLDFFPESDNLDDAQMLIADSWVKQGDNIRAAAGADSADSKVAGLAAEAYAEGVKNYLKFANIYPQSDLISDVFIKLGDAYNKMGETDASAKAFASALGRAKEAEEQAKVQLKIGNYYFERKQYADAIASYQIILNNFLTTEVASNAQYMLGECYTSKGDTIEGIKNFQVILDHYKSSSFLGGAAFKVGDYYFRLGNTKAAMEAYSIGWINDPNGNLAGKTKFQMGMIWVKIAEDAKTEQEKAPAYESAIKEFKEIVKLFGHVDIGEQASYQIARCYVAMGKEDAAREATKSIVVNRDLLLKSVKLFTSDKGDNFEEDVKYWEQAYNDALQDEERSTALYEKAMVLADRLSRYDDAVVAFKDAFELTTKNSKKINISVGLAKAYVNLNEFAQAESLYLELTTNERAGEDLKQSLTIQLYDTYFKAKKYEQAYDGFERFAASLPAHPLTPYAIYRLGSILAQEKKYQEAMDKNQIILDKYPSSNMADKAVLAIAEQMLNLKKAQEAVDYLADYIKKHHDDENLTVLPNMYMKIAEAYTDNLNKKQAAIDTYGKVLADKDEANRFYSFAAYKQGLVFKDIGDEKRAVKSFEKARKSDKSIYRAAQSEIGKIIAKTDPERAIDNYRRIVEESDTQEDSVIAMIGIGDVYSTVKKWDKAAETYQDVYKFYTGNDTNLIAGALVKRVNALISGKQNREAIETAAIVQKNYPNHPLTINTYYFESAALFALKRYQAARAVMQKIIELDRNEQLTEIATYQTADSWFFTKNYPMAVKKYDEYKGKYPAGKFVARATYMQATCYISISEPDYAKARQKFQEVVTKYPDFDEICNARNYLAYCMDRMGDWKPALTHYKQVIGSTSCSAKAREFAKEQYEAVKVKNM